MAKPTSQAGDQPEITTGHGNENTDNTRPSFEFQLIRKPELGLVEAGGMTMVFRPGTAEMEVVQNTVKPFHAINLNIVQW